MNGGRPFRRAIRVIALLVSLFVPVAAWPDASPPASLEGKDLSPASEVQSGFESVAATLLAGEFKGEVTRVVVTADQPERLAVRVSYRGFQGGKIWGEVLGGSRKRVTGISVTEPVVLADGGGEIELAFTWKPEPSGAASATSAMLRLNVARANRQSPSYRRSFELVKTWTPPVPSGADFRIAIAPQPIGRALELGPTPSSVVPAQSIRIPPPPPGVTGTPTPASAPVSVARTAPATARMAPSTTGTRAIVPTTTARTFSAPAPPAAVASRIAAQALPPSKFVVPLREFHFGLQPEETSHPARGPAAIPLRPFGEVRTEDIDLDLTRVLNLFPEVYQDQDPASGIFYFLPHSYALQWDAMEGYELRTIYAAGTGAAPGQVMMAARLDAGIGPRDLLIASKIVQSYALSHGATFRELRALPIDTLSLSLSDDLGRYSVPPDHIAVHGLSDVMGQLDVSWVTDERTKDFIQEALVQNVGINGNVIYAATGGALGARLVPIRILLGDYATFGPMRWDRTGWKNPTPYPVTLRYLHALRMTPGQPPAVLSWSLGDTRVPPGGQVLWKSASVPLWLDGQSEKLWIDYVVDRSCIACGAQALAKITGGVSSAGASEITFHTMTPLADTGAYELLLEVRSRYFDPAASEVQVKSLVLDSDEKDFRLGPLFPALRTTPGAADPLYEFRIGLTMKDGTPVRGNAAWIRSDDLRALIGRNQLERSLGSLPSR